MSNFHRRRLNRTVHGIVWKTGLGWVSAPHGINIFLASSRLERRVLEGCLAVPYAAFRGRSARDYGRNLDDDNDS